MNTNMVKVAVVTIAVVGSVLATSAISLVISALQAQRTITSDGSVKTVGLSVYWDQACTNPVPSISWVGLEPGSNANKTVYLRNEGTTAATLAMTTSSWNPSTASSYITLSWDYTQGQVISVNEVIRVKLRLSVSSSITGITSFTFDITITATGQ